MPHDITTEVDVIIHVAEEAAKTAARKLVDITPTRFDDAALPVVISLIHSTLNSPTFRDFVEKAVSLIHTDPLADGYSSRHAQLKSLADEILYELQSRA